MTTFFTFISIMVVIVVDIVDAIIVIDEIDVIYANIVAQVIDVLVLQTIRCFSFVIVINNDFTHSYLHLQNDIIIKNAYYWNAICLIKYDYFVDVMKKEVIMVIQAGIVVINNANLL